MANITPCKTTGSGYSMPLPNKNDGEKDHLGVYVTADMASSKTAMDRIIRNIKNSGCDTVVVDVKDESGVVRFSTRSWLARKAGAINATINLPELIARLHKEGIRCEVKISVFKDRKLSNLKEDEDLKYQLKYEGQGPEEDSGIRWVDPTDPDVINYNVFLAVELAKMGVDGIQFDYVRYKESRWLETHGRDRVEVITAFLSQARRVLKQLYPDVTLAADVYAAIACRDSEPTVKRIGQDLVKIARIVDRVNLMAYPALYDRKMDPVDLEKYMDITPYKGHLITPVDFPGPIIEMTCDSALKILKDNKQVELGLYLQSFALKKHINGTNTPFNCEYIKAQNDAAAKWGISRLYYWNPSGKYAETWEAVKDFRENDPLKTAEAGTTHPQSPDI